MSRLFWSVLTFSFLKLAAETSNFCCTHERIAITPEEAFFKAVQNGDKVEVIQALTMNLDPESRKGNVSILVFATHSGHTLI